MDVGVGLSLDISINICIDIGMRWELMFPSFPW